MKIPLVLCFHVAMAIAKFQHDYMATHTMEGTVAITTKVQTMVVCSIRGGKLLILLTQIVRYITEQGDCLF